MASGTISKPLNKNVNDINKALRLNEYDVQFRYQYGTAGKTYSNNSVYDTILVFGNWGNNPRLYMITFNGNGNATVEAVLGVAANITASAINGVGSFTFGDYLYGAFISLRGFIYTQSS